MVVDLLPVGSRGDNNKTPHPPVIEDFTSLRARRSNARCQRPQAGHGVQQIGRNIDPVGDEANGIAQIVVRMFDEERALLTPELKRDVTRIGNLAVSILESAMDALEERYVDVSLVLPKRKEDMKAWFHSSLRRLSTCAMEDAPNVKHRTDMICIYIRLERKQMA